MLCVVCVHDRECVHVCVLCVCAPTTLIATNDIYSIHTLTELALEDVVLVLPSLGFCSVLLYWYQPGSGREGALENIT